VGTQMFSHLLSLTSGSVYGCFLCLPIYICISYYFKEVTAKKKQRKFTNAIDIEWERGFDFPPTHFPPCLRVPSTTMATVHADE